MVFEIGRGGCGRLDVCCPTVPATLQRLADEGFRIVLVTNQSDWFNRVGPKAKVESVLARLQAINGWMPACAVATTSRKHAPTDTVYRKPGRGLFDVLVGSGMGMGGVGVGVVGVGEIHMCGDAVGAGDAYPPYRWSGSDAQFAETVGATFHRPVDVLGLTVGFTVSEISPRQELVILMGNPGSGKSTIGREMALRGYFHVEQDVVGTPAAVRRATVANLDTGASVVVDATHGNPKNRDPWIRIAREHSIPCRIVWIVRDGRPFNALRLGLGEDKVPEVAYATYSKYFTEPVAGPDHSVEYVSWV